MVKGYISKVAKEEELFISPRTVENYTSRLYSKIGVKNREELIERFR